MSQQVLIVARGLDIPQAPKSQVAAMRSCVEQLARDPRVKIIYGTTGQSTGLCALVEVTSGLEAERLAAIAQVCGLTNVEIIPLVPPEQLRLGLQEAERVAEAVAVAQQSIAPSPLQV